MMRFIDRRLCSQKNITIFNKLYGFVPLKMMRFGAMNFGVMYNRNLRCAVKCVGV